MKGAGILRKRLQKDEGRPHRFCYTSPLIRAKETAQIILGEREIPLVEEKRIEEICFGKCEGMKFRGKSQIRGAKRFSAFLQIRKTMFLLKEQSRSVNYMKDRLLFVGNCQIGRLKDSHILISTHGAANDSFV